MNIKIDQQVFPVTGLTTEPGQPEQQLRLVGDVQPTAALLLAAGPDGAVWVEATPTGELKTADTGSGLTAVEVVSGNATDTATDLSLANDYTKMSLEVNDYSLDMAFELTDGTYSGDLVLKVGYWEFDLLAIDARINNTVAGEVCAYKLWAWR